MEKYVIQINQNGKPYYLQYETPGTIDPKTHQTIKEPMGWFTKDLSKAFRINDRKMAEAISAAYDNSKVVKIAA